MITADALARELGCTLSDLEDLASSLIALACDSSLSDAAANEFRRRWSKKTGVDYYTETAK